VNAGYRIIGFSVSSDLLAGVVGWIDRYGRQIAVCGGSWTKVDFAGEERQHRRSL